GAFKIIPHFYCYRYLKQSSSYKMAFRVRPNHERIFSTPSQQQSTTSTEQTEETQLVEDIVFVVDEETGEIKEEKQYIEQPVSNQTTSDTSIPELPRKESAKVFSLAMKKRTKVSFM